MSFAPARLRAVEPTCWQVLRRALMSITPVVTEAVPTAAVDEWWRMYYNPEFFAGLTALQAAAILVHEVWHLLRHHAWRARSVAVRPETAYVWNLAADAEIHEGNDKLLTVLETLPADSQPITRLSFDPPLSERGTAESWFHELLGRKTTTRRGGHRVPLLVIPSELDPEDLCPGAGSLGGSGESGVVAVWEHGAPGPGNPSGISRARATTITRAVAEEILKAGKSIGKDGAGIVRWAKEIIDPRVDWRSSLTTAFQGVMASVCGEARWTHRRMSRRPGGDARIILPGYVDTVPRVGVIQDTSGSMSDRQLAICKGETIQLLSTISRGGRAPYVKVRSCDGQAYEAQALWPGADFSYVGGGGTDLTHAFAAFADDLKLARSGYDLIVCMTDGLSPFPKEPFPVPVITIHVGEPLADIKKNYYAPWMDKSPHKIVEVPWCRES